MAKSRQTFGKKEKEKKRLKKRQDKEEKREERKANASSGELEDMLAYVDENGNLSDTPPDPTKKKKIKASDIEVSIPKTERVEVDPNRKGKVSYFDDSKGYGFIIDSETGEKYFFHVSGITEDVYENDKVGFQLERGPKGLNAVKVKKI